MIERSSYTEKEETNYPEAFAKIAMIYLYYEDFTTEG
jgi:hypothetical protein